MNGDFSEYLTDTSQARFSQFLPDGRPQGSAQVAVQPRPTQPGTPGGVSQPNNNLVAAAGGGGDLGNAGAPTPEDFGYTATISPQEALGLAASLMTGPVGFLGQVGNFATRDMAAQYGLAPSPHSGLRGMVGNIGNMRGLNSTLDNINAMSTMSPMQMNAMVTGNPAFGTNVQNVGGGLAGTTSGFGSFGPEGGEFGGLGGGGSNGSSSGGTGFGDHGDAGGEFG